jgi:phosphoribosyl 1,2-cyclic phosphodiesterase
MIIEFPGTKGEIEESSPKHKYHTCLIVRYKKTNILIDLGLKFNPTLLKEIRNFNYILITHAHPDHYIWTLKEENRVDIPVYLTIDTLDYGKYRPKNYKVIYPDRNYELEDLEITAYKVIHSLRCPAVGYRVKGDKSFVYAPDIVDFEQDKAVILNEIDMLIADGSSLNINMVRRRGSMLFGHTRVKTIIGWCKKYDIKKLVITHCGKQIVTMGSEELDKMLKSYTNGNIDVTVAFDGYKMRL